MADEKRNKAQGHSKELPLTKIFWGGGKDGTGAKTAQITLTRNYGGQNLGILTRMFDIARQDFPDANLDVNSVNAVALGGDRRKHMWGIEFEVPAGAGVPDDYAESQGECILSGGR